MAGQPEIESYANHICDTYNLRKYIQFETKVTSATYNENFKNWHVVTNTGATYQTKFLITACGCLSKPNLPQIYHTAKTNFTNGSVLHTSRWPKNITLEDLLGGKKVGVIGTGSSGIQSIPEIAKVAKHVTVFQRTAQYTLPAKNHKLTEEFVSIIKSRYDEIRKVEQQSLIGTSLVKYFGGALQPPDTKLPIPDRTELLMDLTETERTEGLNQEGFDFVRKFIDVGQDPVVNEIMCELYRKHLKTIINDPIVAEGLSPRGYPLGCKRQVIDSGYFETFNRKNVTLVDLRNGGIDSINKNNITTKTTKNDDDGSAEGGIETVHDLDVLVFATGFDALSGPLVDLNLIGRNNTSLKEVWKDGPESYMGLQIHQFPNLFTITGPGSPSVLSNMIVSIEQHVNFISDMITYTIENQIEKVECEKRAQDMWCEEVHERAAPTMLMSKNCSSWYLGSNVSGKPRKFMIYLGVGDYRLRCDEIKNQNYLGFSMTR